MAVASTVGDPAGYETIQRKTDPREGGRTRLGDPVQTPVLELVSITGCFSCISQ